MVTQRTLAEQRAAGSSGQLELFLASVERRAFIMARLSTRNDDDALDIIQDTMLRMVQKYTDKPADNWSPLFFRILANRLTDHHRRRGFSRLLQWRGAEPGNDEAQAEPVDQLENASPEPDQALNASKIDESVRNALGKLPERQRQVFLLRQWHGMSVSETADALGISCGSVKTHLSRAQTGLRSKMQAYASHD